MSKPVPQIIIRFKDRNKKNLDLAKKVNEILKSSFSEFENAIKEVTEIKDWEKSDIDPNVYMFFDDVYQKFAEVIYISNMQMEAYQDKFVHFENVIRDFQEEE